MGAELIRRFVQQFIKASLGTARCQLTVRGALLPPLNDQGGRVHEHVHPQQSVHVHMHGVEEGTDGGKHSKQEFEAERCERD